MSIEQLKMIIDAMKDVSGGVQVVAILWVLRGYFIATIGFGVLTYAIFQTFRLLLMHIKSRCVDAMVTALTGSYYPHASDYENVNSWAVAGKELSRSMPECYNDMLKQPAGKKVK